MLHQGGMSRVPFITKCTHLGINVATGWRREAGVLGIEEGSASCGECRKVSEVWCRAASNIMSCARQSSQRPEVVPRKIHLN
jgi:hypothetical protein